jgi:hypothetical protein
MKPKNKKLPYPVREKIKEEEKPTITRTQSWA